MLISMFLDGLRNLEILNNLKEKYDDNYFEIGMDPNIGERAIKKIVILSYLSLEAINFTRLNKANLIISYYPLFWANNQTQIKKSHPLTIDNIERKKLFLLTQNNIMVYIINQSWVYAPKGIYNNLLEKLNLKVQEIESIDGSSESEDRNILLTKPDGDLVFDNKKKIFICDYIDDNIKNLGNYLENIKRLFNIEKLEYFKPPNTNNVPKKIAFGEYIQIEDLKKLYLKGVKCIISEEFNSLIYNFAKEYKIVLIRIPLEHIINQGMNILSKYLAMEFPQIEIIYYDEEINRLFK